MFNYKDHFQEKARVTAASCLMVGNLLSKVSVVKEMSQAQYLALSKFENIKNSRGTVIEKLFGGIEFSNGLPREHKAQSFAEKCKMVGEELIETGLRCADQHKVKVSKRDFHVTVKGFEEALATCAQFINTGGLNQSSHIKDLDGHAYQALTRHDADMRYCDLMDLATRMITVLHTAHKLRHGTGYALLDSALAQLKITEDTPAYLNDIAYHDYFSIFNGNVAQEIHFNPETGSSGLKIAGVKFSPCDLRTKVIKAPGNVKAA